MPSMDVDFYYFQFCLCVCMFRFHLLNHTSGRAQTFRWEQSTYIRGRVMNGLDVNWLIVIDIFTTNINNN